MYRVRYTFAGSSGAAGRRSTMEEAEVVAKELREHYYNLANVWIERICDYCGVPLLKAGSFCSSCQQNIKKYKDQYNAGRT